MPPAVQLRDVRGHSFIINPANIFAIRPAAITVDGDPVACFCIHPAGPAPEIGAFAPELPHVHGPLDKLLREIFGVVEEPRDPHQWDDCGKGQYLFDIGNSSTGQVGFCARMAGESAQDALDRLKEILAPYDDTIASLGELAEHEEGEYMNTYLNTDNITLADITDFEADDADDADEAETEAEPSPPGE